MLSILHPEPELDPKTRKRIARLSFLTGAATIYAVFVPVVSLLVSHPPHSIVILAPITSLIGLFLGARVYRLRNPRRT